MKYLLITALVVVAVNAGAICRQGDVRLVGQERMPELFWDKKFRPICGHYFWDSKHGYEAVCKKLGYPGGHGHRGAHNVAFPIDGISVGRCHAGDDISHCEGSWNHYNPHEGACKRGSRHGLTITCTGKRQGGYQGTSSCLPVLKKVPTVVIGHKMPEYRNHEGLNVDDRGWIARPSDRLDLRAGKGQLVSGIRFWSVYRRDARGCPVSVQTSLKNGGPWKTVEKFDYVTVKNGATQNANGFAGWYQFDFSPSHDQYYRILFGDKTSRGLHHCPRTSTVELLGRVADQYLYSQEKVGVDEKGEGYHSEAGTFKGELPEKCKKLCIGGKCRRHCIQSHLHGQKADAETSKKLAYAKQLKAVTIQKEELEIKLRDATARAKYHNQKRVEWMTAAKHQHDLDVATSKLTKARAHLKQAQDDEKKAKTQKQAAYARRKEAKAEKDKSQALLDTAIAGKKVTDSTLKTQRTVLATLEKKRTATKLTIRTLEKALAKYKKDIATHTSHRNKHAAHEIKHAAHESKHSKAEKEASNRIAKHTKTESGATNNHKHLRERAEKSHKKAKKGAPPPATAKKFIEMDDDFQNAFLETEEEVERDFF